MSNIVPYTDIEKMAHAMASSKLFGITTPEQAVALMLIAQAEGKHPAIAARDYHIIQGRPALKADTMLARFQQAGGKVEWKTYTNEKVVGIFSHPQGGSIEIEWSYAMATAAGLTGKQIWKQYPRQMLRARCISEGIRTVYPGIAAGVYVVEEMEDLPQQMVDITPTDGEISAKEAYGSARAMKAKFQEIVDAINNSNDSDELQAAAEKFKADLATMKRIDQNFYDNIMQVSEIRLRSIQEAALNNQLDNAIGE